jgi:hypothetical protein
MLYIKDMKSKVDGFNEEIVKKIGTQGAKDALKDFQFILKSMGENKLHIMLYNTKIMVFYDVLTKDIEKITLKNSTLNFGRNASIVVKGEIFLIGGLGCDYLVSNKCY